MTSRFLSLRAEIIASDSGQKRNRDRYQGAQRLGKNGVNAELELGHGNEQQEN